MPTAPDPRPQYFDEEGRWTRAGLALFLEEFYAHMGGMYRNGAEPMDAARCIVCKEQHVFAAAKRGTADVITCGRDACIERYISGDFGPTPQAA